MTTAHIALLVLINAFWGYNFIAGKIGTVVFGPLLFSTLRFAIVLVLLIPWLRRVPDQMRRITMIGLLLGAGHYSIMFFAVNIGDNLSSIAIAAQLCVPFSTLLAVLWLGERIGITRTSAIIVSFLGVVVIGFEPISSDHILALSLATVASLSMAIAAILMRQLQNVGVFNLQAWIALISVLSLSLLTAVFEPQRILALPGIPLIEYWSPAYSGIVATIIGHGTLYYLIQRYEVNHVTPFLTLGTLFAIGYSVWLMDDALTPKIMLGALLTLVGVTVIARRNAKQLD